MGGARRGGGSWGAGAKVGVDLKMGVAVAAGGVADGVVEEAAGCGRRRPAQGQGHGWVGWC